MGRLILITGGAKSGKSAEAERQLEASSLDKVAYVATQASQAVDGEMAHHIKVHRQRRPSSWHTIEAYQDLDQVIRQAHDSQRYEAYLIDCLTLWTTNLFFDHLPHYLVGKYDLDQVPHADTYDDYLDQFEGEDLAYFDGYFMGQLHRLLNQIQRTPASFWLVTNEIGSGLVPPTRLGRLYRHCLGKINQAVAQQSDQVFLTVSGIAVQIKGADSPC